MIVTSMSRPRGGGASVLRMWPVQVIATPVCLRLTALSSFIFKSRY